MSDFYELAHTAEDDPDSADFAALRAAYVKSDAYRPYKHIPQQKLLHITNTAADFTEVVDTCTNILHSNPADLEARMTLAIALEKTGNPDQARKAHMFAERMLDAILTTGDGKSFESAFRLVSDTEAWTVMRSFGIKAKSHTRHRREDGVFDVYEGIINDRAVTVYFDVTDPVRIVDSMTTDEPDT